MGISTNISVGQLLFEVIRVKLHKRPLLYPQLLEMAAQKLLGALYIPLFHTVHQPGMFLDRVKGDVPFPGGNQSDPVVMSVDL